MLTQHPHSLEGKDVKHAKEFGQVALCWIQRSIELIRFDFLKYDLTTSALSVHIYISIYLLLS